MKNFTKQNFKTNPLWIRLLIMAFMLLGASSTWAYNQSAVDLYFDNSEAKWANCYVYIGKSDYTSCYAMSRVSGTQYLWKLAYNFNGGNSWDNATGWVVCYEKWWDNQHESIDKFTWHGDKNVTQKNTSAWVDTKIYKTNETASTKSDNHTINAYKVASSTKYDYKVTINQATGGTLTVNDYDNNTVSNGASKIYLTVLKFSASASSGYDFTEVQIDNGSTTTTISKADLTTKTYTLTSNVTITPVWESLCAKSATEGKGSFRDGTIKLSAKFNTCGDAYIGFQWKKQDDIDWCYTNDGTEKCYKALGEKNKSNAVEETSFTKINNESLSGTYVFRPYIVDGSDATKWIYGEDFEVATCTSINDFTLTFEDGNELGLANNTQANLSTDAEVNWSSSNDQIASVSNSGVVTGYKWGTATITATTTGNDEYCANQTASANITIKEFPRISISGTTPFCGETTELTASIDNISNDNTEYTISWYKEGDANVKGTGATFNANEGVYYAKVTGDFLETATSDQLTVTKKLTPTAANFNYEAPDNLEYNSETKTATVIWNSTQGGAITIAYSSSNPAVTPVDPINVGTYYVFVSTVEDEDFCAVNNLYIGTFTITCPSIAAPAITTSATVCAGTQVTLSNYNGVNDNTVKWYSDEECNSEVTEQVTLTDNDTKYYAKAYNEASGCYSSEYSTLTFTVNPLPTISIEKTEPTTVYKYADVKLKANGDNISTVVWSADKGTITRQPNHPDESDRAMLTYDQKGTVTVTATATSEFGCTATSSEFQVEFTEEDCSGTTSTDLIIICDPNGEDDDIYCYIWDTSDNKPLGGWPGTKGTKKNGKWTWTIENTSATYKLIFNNNNNCQTNNIDDKVTGGWQYTYKLAESGWCKSDVCKTYTDKTSLSTPATKSNPTIKTVSVTSNKDGEVTLNGMVVTTGCNDQAKLGLQYKKQNQDGTWPDAYSTVEPNTKEDISKGKTYTTTVTLEDGTYKVRACAHVDNTLKGYGYDIIITVSTTKIPISNVTLNYCDENCGNVGVDPNPMCKGATAYVKLEYAGSNYSDIKWLVEGVETNLVTDKGDGVWSYIIQGTGHLSVELRNDANKDNEDNPTWATGKKLSFTMKEEPAAPYISINPASGIICEGSEATIKVENPSKACSYKLVEEEDTKAGFKKYESGDLKYSVGSVGKYYVAAKHIECSTNEYTSNQVAINQIIRTSAKISIEPANAETTPWEPVTITVKPDAGYIYKLSYTDGNLAAVDGVRIKQNGDSYTYYIPRPTGWGEGNAVSERTPVTYGIKAQLKVDGEANQCNLSFDTATITVKDEKDEDCD